MAASTAARPTARSGAQTPDKPQVDPVVVPPPMGTIRRMDAISKAFSRK
jgi:hypothetical protein